MCVISVELEELPVPLACIVSECIVSEDDDYEGR